MHNNFQLFVNFIVWNLSTCTQLNLAWFHTQFLNWHNWTFTMISNLRDFHHFTPRSISRRGNKAIQNSRTRTCANIVLSRNLPLKTPLSFSERGAEIWEIVRVLQRQTRSTRVRRYCFSSVACMNEKWRV